MNLETNHSTPAGRREKQTHVASKGLQSLHEKMDRLMAKNKPSKREQDRQVFRDMYPKLEFYLAQERPLKDVLAAFNELAKSKVCARTFNDMFEEERALRDRNGDPVRCNLCGHALHSGGSEAASLPGSPSTLSSTNNLIESESWKVALRP